MSNKSLARKNRNKFKLLRSKNIKSGFYRSPCSLNDQINNNGRIYPEPPKLLEGGIPIDSMNMFSASSSNAMSKLDPVYGAQYGYMADINEYVSETPYTSKEARLSPMVRGGLHHAWSLNK